MRLSYPGFCITRAIIRVFDCLFSSGWGCVLLLSVLCSLFSVLCSLFFVLCSLFSTRALCCGSNLFSLSLSPSSRIIRQPISQLQTLPPPPTTKQAKNTPSNSRSLTSISLAFLTVAVWEKYTSPSPFLNRISFSLPPTFKLAGNKRRGSNQGGLLNRMFSGSSSPPKDKSESVVPHSNSIDTPAPAETAATSSSSPLAVTPEDSTVSSKKLSPPTGFFSRKVSNDDPGPAGERKTRRSSTVNKAATFFSNAKQSLTLSTSREDSSNGFGSFNPLHKLGNMDTALNVPQGSGNNSAGDSLPTLRSSFRVGVTEDKNRKCRRTMEDTHAYLYNFLSTPAPSPRAPDVNGSGQPLDTTVTNNSTTLTTSLTKTTTASSSQPLSPTASSFNPAANAVETDNGYFAIFDGHAGTFAAEWCGKKLHFVLQEILRKNPNAPVPELLDQTFTSVDQQLDKLPLKNSGCTAVIALLRWEDRVPSSQSATGSAMLATAAAEATKTDSDSASTETPTQSLPKLQEKAVRQRVLYTANVGDARAVLCRSGKALRLSYDHKGSDENEGKRIANAGGLVLNNRVNGVLAVTRALGDAYLKDLVTGHPYTTETVIQPEGDEFVILACDGVRPSLSLSSLYRLDKTDR